MTTGWLSLLLQLVQNRVHLYNLFLLKIRLFNRWLSGLAQEAWGCRGCQAPPAASPLGRALRAGLGLLGVPVWLGLRVPQLAWAGVRRCAWTLGLAPKRLGLSAATCTDLLLSGLHGLMLAGLLLLLLTWRLCRRARRRCSLGRLLSKVGGPGGARAGLGPWAWPLAHPLIPSRHYWTAAWCRSSGRC